MNVLNRMVVIFAVFATTILLISIVTMSMNPKTEPVLVSSCDPEPFYVGVTYCGESVEEAKLLIDRVKNYSNLFVIQSGPLQFQHEKMNQIVDYAVNADLHFIVHFGIQNYIMRNEWLETFDPSWENQFLGLYVGDEPAGKLLDGPMNFIDGSSQNSIRKQDDGSVYYYFNEPTENGPAIRITYRSDGTINFWKIKLGNYFPETYSTYYTNGTIKVETEDLEGNLKSIEDFSPEDLNGTIIQIEDYISYSVDELWKMYPFSDYSETSARYIETVNCDLEHMIEGYRQVSLFTSDYALYWFDYISGYDVLFAQIGWNHTLAQDIALVRGAANLQNKNWGTIVTWKYNHPPYLDSGEAIFEQLCTSYEAGAKYAVIFNYAENMTGPYGTLQEEHFVALESFWNEVVQNPDVNQGSIRGEAVLVLPENYGWGMRNPDDRIWGIWDADEKSDQIWNLRSNLIEEYGFNLDIVYDDPEFPVEGKYGQIFYWNQTT